MQTSLALFEGFTLAVSYTYLDTRIQQVTQIQTPANNPYEVSSSATVGDPLPLSPKNKVSTTGTYALPLSENIGRIAMSATFTHTGSQAVNYSDATATTNPAVSSLGTLPPLNLLNLNLNWTSIAATHLDLALFASNVANKQYYTWVPGIYTLVGFETAELGQPRMYGLRVRYSW